jgi:excisionase family DNA binding protein
MTVFTFDQAVAGHVAVALRRHRNALRKSHREEPPGLAELEDAVVRIVNGRQQASPSVTVPTTSVTVPADQQDDVSEPDFLTRDDVRRITRTSLATVDRWIASGQLPSCRRGRIRRIARADLDEFLAA